MIFAALPVVYAVLYGFNGFSDTDGGFIPGLAWRVLNGEVPYLDFIYVRPPLSPVLHSAELWFWPDSWELWGMRLDYYLMMWGSVVFGLLALRRHFPLAEWGISPWALGSIAFMLGVHNFPALPWHTVDGIFFGAMGVWLVTGRTSTVLQALGILALAISGLAKQPFMVLLPMGLVLLPFVQPKRTAILGGLLGLGMIGGLAGLVLLLLPEGFAAAMWEQVMGAGEGSVLLETGVLNYGLPAVMAAAAIGLVVLGENRASVGRVVGYAMMAGLVALPLLYAGLQFWKMSFVSPIWGTYHALLLLAWVAAVVMGVEGNRKAAAIVMALGMVAWASGLSWGYAMPVLFALPGVFGLAWWAQRAFKDRMPGFRILPFLVFIACFLWQLFPYRDAPSWELVSGAGDIFPKLGHVRTSPANLGRWKELAAIDSMLQGRYAVLPAQPGVHWLTGSKPSLPTEWEHDAEVGTQRIGSIVARARDLNLPIVVEMDRIAEADGDDPHYRSSLLKEFLDDQRWPVVLLGKWFQVRVPGYVGMYNTGRPPVAPRWIYP